MSTEQMNSYQIFVHGVSDFLKEWAKNIKILF